MSDGRAFTQQMLMRRGHCRRELSTFEHCVKLTLIFGGGRRVLTLAVLLGCFVETPAAASVLAEA